MNLNYVPNSTDDVDQSKEIERKSAPRSVNMDKLISRYKKERAKEKTETFIFVGLACALVVISGILVSL